MLFRVFLLWLLLLRLSFGWVLGILSFCRDTLQMQEEARERLERDVDDQS